MTEIKRTYRIVKIDDVLRYFANQYKAPYLIHEINSDVMCDWWLDPAKGEIVFSLYHEIETDD